MVLIVILQDLLLVKEHRLTNMLHLTSTHRTLELRSMRRSSSDHYHTAKAMLRLLKEKIQM